MTIKGSFVLEHPNGKAISAVKSVPKMTVTHKFKRLNEILIVVIGTPKRHILGRTDVCWRIFRKIMFSVKTGHPDGTENDVYWELKPLEAARQNLACRVMSTTVSPCQFLSRLVKPFLRGEGSNFGLFEWLARSPLKHFRTNVTTSNKVTAHFTCIHYVVMSCDLDLWPIYTKIGSQSENLW